MHSVFFFCSMMTLAQHMDIWLSQPFNPNNFFREENGIYTDSGQALGDSSSWSIGVGDVNGDGSLDVAVANDGACYVHTNDGTGVFTRTSIFGAGLPVGHSISLVDMNLDGNLDIVMATLVSTFSGDNQIFINDGSGIFTTPTALFGMANTRSIAVADLNGDDYPDVFEANQGGEPNRVWFNDQTGVVTDSSQMLGTSSSFSVALGDLDGNGSLDAVVANDGQPNVVWWNDGSGQFTSSLALGGSDNSTAVALGDLNGDTFPDVVFGQDGAISGAPLLVYWNDGVGNLTLSSQAFPSPRTLSVHLVDLNRDGRKDMVLGNIGADHIWLNQGGSMFQLTANTLSSDYSSSVFGGFFRTTRSEAQAQWAQNWTIIDLLQFDRQLKALDEPTRGR
ncbi:MAG: VCBS repeat-containing protein [Acidobacteria bacterium]|nr:VCBS repeat-containing protein [Acidobacteriota bacterium]